MANRMRSEIQSWYWARNSPGPLLAFAVFEYFVDNAEPRACVKDGVRLRRGQFKYVAKSFCEDWNIPVQTLRTICNKMCEHNLTSIQHQTNKKSTIITICNFNDYEIPQRKSNMKSNTKVTRNQHETNMIVTNHNIGTHDINTINNDKGLNNNYPDRKASTGARARGGGRSSGGTLPVIGEIAAIANDPEWLNAVAEKYRTTVEALQPLFATFRTDCITNGKVRHDSLADCKSHFSNWLRVQIENSRKKRGQGTPGDYDFYAHTGKADDDDIDMKAAYEQVKAKGLLSDRV